MIKFILLILLMMPFSSMAASFNCANAKSFVEKTICSDPELSRLDDELTMIYRRAKLVAHDKEAFQVAARASWNKRERDCRTRSCIIQWYRERKSSLLAEIELSNATGLKCLHYQSRHTLTGRLVRKTYPGAPNYESIEKGDEPETGFYLMLDSPVCTVGGRDFSEEARTSVSQVQLILDSSTYAMLRPLISRRIKVSGHLFSSHTGHHHAPLLFEGASLVDVVEN